jgi:hypothetical protein
VPGGVDGDRPPSAAGSFAGSANNGPRHVNTRRRLVGRRRIGGCVDRLGRVDLVGMTAPNDNGTDVPPTPPGWTVKSWAAELRRRAGCMLDVGIHERKAAAWLAYADAVDAGRLVATTERKRTHTRPKGRTPKTKRKSKTKRADDQTERGLFAQ